MAIHKPLRACRLADELYLKVKFIADLEHRSFNNYLESLLSKVVTDYETVHGTIEADTDALYE